MGVWFYLVTISIWAWISLKECSRVFDTNDNKKLYVSDYCPFINGCKPGSHVMCMFNPNNIPWYGPKCHGTQEIIITDQIAIRLLNIINAIRRKAALGLETGKGGKPLPRAYGLWRLEWDNELSTFAQMWANQCVFSKDNCHATDRFPSPGQSLGIFRFTYPDWKPIYKTWDSPPGFSPKNVAHCIIKTIKSWYKSKLQVEPKDILKATKSPNQYMSMVSGELTHMGCGVSAYTEYQFNSEKVEFIHNIVQLVCNFSHKLMDNNMTYNTTRPTTPEFSAKCGCPAGSMEDEDCLCSRITPDTTRNCTGKQCKPTVVLLPIFTVEDAPYNKLPIAYGRQNIDTLRTQNYTDVFDEYERDDIADIENQLDNHEKQYEHSPWSEKYPPNIGILKNKTLFYSQSPTIVNNPYSAVKSYIPNKNTLMSEFSAQPRKEMSTNYPRSSIFSHPDIFVNKKPPMDGNTIMKVQSVNSGVPRKTLQITMRDVVPRKNFNQVNDLLKIYMDRKRKLGFNRYKYNSNNKKYSQLYKTRRGKFNEYPLSSMNDNNVKQIMVFDGHKYTNTTLVNLYKDLKDRKFSFDNFNDITKSDYQVDDTITNSNDYADNRLMKLLDKLEEEVRHIELRGREKELFDAKIKKIYGNIIKKHYSQNPSGNFKSSLFHDTGNDSYLRNHNRRMNNFNHNDISLKTDKTNFESNEDEASGVRLLGASTYDKYDDDDDDDEGYLQQDTTRKRFSNPYGNYYHKENFNLRPNNNRPTINENAKYTSRKETADPLDEHRRKYYQDKLESLKRRFHNIRNRHMGNNRGIRPIRPTEDVLIQPRRMKHDIDDAMYLPSRGRVIHGY